MAHPPSADAHGHAHSHSSLYIRTGVILTVITAIELGVLVEPFKSMIPAALFVPSLIGMSIVKFAMVIGIFMHLRDDQKVYSFLFLSPLFLAIFSFIALGILAIVTFQPFGKGYAVTAYDQRFGYALPEGGKPADPPWEEPKFQAAFVDAQAGGFDKGKQIFVTNCASCHGPNAGGLAGLGANLTDDCVIYGPRITDVYNTVVHGVQNKTPSMTAWSGILSSEDIRQVSYYVRSLRGTNVAGGRECQGDKVAP